MNTPVRTEYCNCDLLCTFLINGAFRLVRAFVGKKGHRLWRLTLKTTVSPNAKKNHKNCFAIVSFHHSIVLKRLMSSLGQPSLKSK
jgi:hypothetical protein